MSNYRIVMLAALLPALSGVHLFAADAVATLRINSGDGQVACQCVSSTLYNFQPISVLALNAVGSPVNGATITWTVTSGQATVQNPTSTTGADGIATMPISQTVITNQGTLANPFLSNTILASANAGNPSVTFYETMSLVNTKGQPYIASSLPFYNGNTLDQATLAGPSGSTLGAPIQLFVGQNGNAVGNVSIRLLSAQASPSITCANTGIVGDPGTVLTTSSFISTNPPLNVSCTPVVSGGGTGQFYVIVGGAVNPTAPNDVTQAQYLSAYGPYTFTSIPGTPVQFLATQGDNQAFNPPHDLGVLIAQLVDSKGNGVSGVPVVWNASPPAPVALSQATTVTDNNGYVHVNAGMAGFASGAINVTVTTTTGPILTATFHITALANVANLAKISGDSQSAPVNSAFAQPLVVQVQNSGGGGIGSYPVNFAITGPGTLAAGTANTDASGLARMNVTAGSTTGTITVTASVGTLSRTFTLTVTPAGPAPTSLIKVSGDPQSAAINTQFSPLVVQVVANGVPLSNYVVNYTFTGPITLASNTAATGANGQASMIVTAGGTTGAATVTASVPGFSVTFNLTVNPPGPNISASSFLNGASGQQGSISPCSIATLSASGLAPNGASSLAAAPIFGPLPTQVNGLSISFNGTLAPIFNVSIVNGTPQAMFQVPCEVTPGSSVPVVVTLNGGNTSLNVPVAAASPGIFQRPYSDNVVRAVALRNNGSFVTINPVNPARVGEVVRVYVTGLGPSTPLVGTNQVDNPGADLLGVDARATGQVIVNVNGTGAQVMSARVAPDLIGVYEVAFVVPANTTGNDVPFTVSVVPQGSAGARFDSLTAKLTIQ